MIPQEEIYPNPNQPRKRFDFDELEGLAQSIRQNGIIQPIAVRINNKGEYELISGVENNAQVVIAGQKALLNGMEVMVEK